MNVHKWYIGCLAKKALVPSSYIFLLEDRVLENAL